MRSELEAKEQDLRTFREQKLDLAAEKKRSAEYLIILSCFVFHLFQPQLISLIL